MCALSEPTICRYWTVASPLESATNQRWAASYSPWHTRLRFWSCFEGSQSEIWQQIWGQNNTGSALRLSICCLQSTMFSIWIALAGMGTSHFRAGRWPRLRKPSEALLEETVKQWPSQAQPRRLAQGNESQRQARQASSRVSQSFTSIIGG